MRVELERHDGRRGRRRRGPPRDRRPGGPTGPSAATSASSEPTTGATGEPPEPAPVRGRLRPAGRRRDVASPAWRSARATTRSGSRGRSTGSTWSATDGPVRFRVIDYKTGSCPPTKDVDGRPGLAAPALRPGRRAARACRRGESACTTSATGACRRTGSRAIELEGLGGLSRPARWRSCSRWSPSSAAGRSRSTRGRRTAGSTAIISAVCRIGQVRAAGKVWDGSARRWRRDR